MRRNLTDLDLLDVAVMPEVEVNGAVVGHISLLGVSGVTGAGPGCGKISVLGANKKRAIGLSESDGVP